MSDEDIEKFYRMVDRHTRTEEWNKAQRIKSKLQAFAHGKAGASEEELKQLCGEAAESLVWFMAAFFDAITQNDEDAFLNDDPD